MAIAYAELRKKDGLLPRFSRFRFGNPHQKNWMFTQNGQIRFAGSIPPFLWRPNFRAIGRRGFNLESFREKSRSCLMRPYGPITCAVRKLCNEPGRAGVYPTCVRRRAGTNNVFLFFGGETYLSLLRLPCASGSNSFPWPTMRRHGCASAGRPAAVGRPRRSSAGAAHWFAAN